MFQAGILNRLVLSVSLALLGALAAGAAPAHATFPGVPGPLVYPRTSFDESTGGEGGLFAHGPRLSQKPRQLTSFEDDSAPSFSADGKLIAFSSDRDADLKTGAHIYVMNADGTGAHAITSGAASDSDPSFSPDGERIVFDRRTGGGAPPRIYVVGVDGSGLRPLTDGSSGAWDPVFTPNGRRIVYVGDGAPDARTDHSDIWAMGPGGADQRVLIDGPRNESEPDVSPNGRAILFASNRFHESNIYVARANGKHVRSVTHNRGDCFRGTCWVSPTWAPDGKHIAALGLGRYKSDLEVMRPDGSQMKEFDSGGTEEEGYGSHVGAPAWGVVPR